MTKTIDVHWHHVPKAFADADRIGRGSDRRAVVTKDDGTALVKMDNGFKQPLPPFLTDPATIIADLDAAGVDVACRRSRHRCRTWTAIPQIALGVSRAINDSLQGSPKDTTAGSSRWATCRSRTSISRLQELKRIVTTTGSKGSRSAATSAARTSATSRSSPSGKQVRETDLFVFSHGLSPLGPERMAEHELKNFVGLPIDTAVSVGSMVFGGVYERLPGLKVCYSHGGGAVPVPGGSMGPRLSRPAEQGSRHDDQDAERRTSWISTRTR